MLEKGFSIFQQYLKPRNKIIIGVSGGPDSIALLDLLVEFSRQTPMKIMVAHINHGLRGKDALRDEKFVKNLSKSYGLKCFVKRVKLSGKSHFEERGRAVRRAFFEKLLQQYQAQYILTAHTEDDQIETIIFNFLRGSGPAGLAGMQVRNGFYLKPFLGIPKAEILQYLLAKKIKFHKDNTNEDNRFRRNFIRHKILPLLSNINPSFRKTILRNAFLFTALDEWLTNEAKKFLKKHRRQNKLFPLKAYQTLPRAIQLTILQEAYRILNETSYRLPIPQIQEITRILERGIGNKKIRCSGDIVFLLQKGFWEYI